MKFKQVSMDIYKLTNNLIHRSEFKTEEEFQKIVNNKIWELLLPKAKTDIQKRIITSIEWIGKANSEVNNKSRFIFYVFAIESMLTFQEKSFITPAIAHSISESSAIILGDNYEDRIIMEENVKEIYSIRSAIAHGSGKEVSDNELNLVMNISRNIVIQFLTNTELTEINNIDQFIEYLKKKSINNIGTHRGDGY